MPRAPAAAALPSSRLARPNDFPDVHDWRKRPDMEADLFRFDDRRGHERKRTNYFGSTIVILLLCGMAMAAWLASFYIIGQPERP